ncbi:ABC transporter permease [Ideonella sp. 4Y11]|uniref:ABC transporter permease n=1 Tax=Ideonella aquatica TaxID=2824119 RepID=A0A941BKN7_9BURK|nr:ABC transporter permease [Ideonella aquatica]MBQ0958799.1 ABC transporter permease [Ideonella aquatica]
MAESAARSPAAAHWRFDGSQATLELQGDWRTADTAAAWSVPAEVPASVQRVQVLGAGLQGWDSRLAARLWQLGAELAQRQPALALDLTTLPGGLREVLSLASASSTRPARPPEPDGLARLGLLLARSLERATVTLGFVGETLMALGRLLRGRTAMRGQDLLHQLWATGPASLPIVSLVSALVGLIIAYLGAAQLQRFGAQIYMADLVTIGEVREVAALMTAVILAGRVGAAFAAQLGSMQANEEIDALRTLGLDPVEHLVLPRTLALTLMAPLLTVYAALVAMVAGMFVAVGIFAVEPLEYLVRSFNSLTLAHVSIGLLKATVYGLLVALAGCRQGLHAGRSAQAVGDATTAAVVQAIVWIVVAASALTISFQRLGW